MNFSGYRIAHTVRYFDGILCLHIQQLNLKLAASRTVVRLKKYEVSNMAKTRNQSPEKTRQSIIDKARELIMAQGVKGTSIADIARTTGMSKGTLFYYYPSKNNLIFDVTDQHFEQVTRTLVKVMTARKNEDPRELFKLGFTGIINEAARGQLNLYLVQDAVTGNEELKERFKQKYEDWRQMMLQLLKDIFPDNDEKELVLYASILVAVLDGLIIQWLLDPEQVPVAEIADCLAGSLIRGSHP